jgi:VWFA-related protein
VLKTLLGPAVLLTLLLPQQQPVFRTGVATVAVYATVTDRYGQLIGNLRKEDFKIFDNSRIQEITAFSTAPQPVSAVLLVDTSASMALTLDLARQAAEQFIIRMMPGDQARVGSFSDRIDLGRPFSGDRDLLLRAFRENLKIGNPTRLWDALNETMTALTDVSGRRVVVLFTDGEDTASVIDGRAVLERAKAEEFMIYAVQLRSRARPGLEWEILGAQASQVARERIRRGMTPVSVLRGLATQTGGLHFTLTQNDDVNVTFTQVATELHQQYLLGFTPEADGRIHNLQVQVRHPRLLVRARKFYQAPKPAR